MILDREHNRHVAFGAGIHRCAGSNLARLELRVALQTWMERIPDFELIEPERGHVGGRSSARPPPLSRSVRVSGRNVPVERRCRFDDASAETWAFCGVHPDAPYAAKAIHTLAASAGIDATFGPCMPPDWSTYTAAEPGGRYADPDTYFRLTVMNASEGMKTIVYDAAPLVD